MFHGRKLRIDLYIPDDILNDILVRLPRKSLSRFRCVSKHWNRLILDPKFNDLRSCEKILLLGRQICRVIDKRVTGDHEYLMTPHHSPFQGRRVRVGGTFNGILLLALGDSYHKADIMLYNPLTREYNKVPDLPPNLVPPLAKYHSEYPIAIGFGHDGVTQQDEKKIVAAGRVTYLKNNNNNNKNTQPRSLYWNVFSVKNKSWSTLKRRMLNSEFYTYAGTFVNESLYWIITHRDSSFFCPSALHKRAKKLILALDVKEMMFSEIELPDKDHIAFDVLGTVKGRLCFVACSYPESYKLLAMNKQGFWETHTNSCLTSLRGSWEQLPHYRRFHAMCIFDEGKIFMMNNKTKKLIICDLLKDSCERDLYEFEPFDDDGGESYVWERRAIEYEQTRVSPNDLLVLC